MSARPPTSHLPRDFLRWSTAVSVGLALLALGLLPPTAAAGGVAAPPAGPTSYSPTSWNNSAVLCRFNAETPGATISALGAPSDGLTIGLGTITESSAVVPVAATASLSAVVWTTVNTSSPTAYSLAYYAEVPVRTVLDLPLGTANVTIEFDLPRTSASSELAMDTVAFSMTVAGWPWQALFPDISANLTFAVAAPSTEHLSVDTSVGMLVESVANRTGAPAAYFAMPSTANATSPGGTTAPISLSGAMETLGPLGGVLSVSFGHSAANASSFGFSAPMVVVPPGPVLSLPGGVHVPVVDLVAVIAAATVVSLAIAGATRRVRRAPSDLEFVEEES